MILADRILFWENLSGEIHKTSGDFNAGDKWNQEEEHAVRAGRPLLTWILSSKGYGVQTESWKMSCIYIGEAGKKASLQEGDMDEFCNSDVFLKYRPSIKV